MVRKPFEKGKSGNPKGRKPGYHKPRPKTEEELQAIALKDADELLKWCRRVIKGPYSFEEKEKAAQILKEYTASLAPPKPPRIAPVPIDVSGLEKVIREFKSDLQHLVGELMQTAEKAAKASMQQVEPVRTEPVPQAPVEPAPAPIVSPDPRALGCPPRITTESFVESGGDRFAVSDEAVWAEAQKLGWSSKNQIPLNEIESIRRGLAFKAGDRTFKSYHDACTAAGAIMKPMKERPPYFRLVN